MQEHTDHADTDKMVPHDKFIEVLELTRPVCSQMSTPIDEMSDMNVNDDYDNGDGDNNSTPSCPFDPMNLVRALRSFRFPKPSRHLSSLNGKIAYTSLAEIIGIRGESSYWNTCNTTILYLKQKQLGYLLGRYGHHTRSPKYLAMVVKKEPIVQRKYDEWQRSNKSISKKKPIHLTVLSGSPGNYHTHVLMASADGFLSCVTADVLERIKTTKGSLVQGTVDTKVNQEIDQVLQDEKHEKRKMSLGMKGIQKTITKKFSKVKDAVCFRREPPPPFKPVDPVDPIVPTGMPVLEGVAVIV